MLLPRPSRNSRVRLLKPSILRFTSQANETRFHSGTKALADYAHSKSILLGIYNDVGTRTCGNYPGECKDENCTLPGYIALDAETYAAWGIDSLKMDGCNSVHSAEVLDSAYMFIGATVKEKFVQ